ncbi:MAG: nicotinamide riboside transporter PnuC [Bacteroidia bacterium]|nr:nicotinamide riboside transporter PnuC [Bacteroidia bacterium]MDW8301113.1 nicotinamide riboside transporter PnuC [Bacteroidia bacterium]
MNKDFIIEIIAVVISVLAVLLTIRQSLWGWILGITGCILYIYIFSTANLYGNMSLQVVFIINSLAGIYNWKYGAKDKPQLPLSRLNKMEKVLFPFAIIILTGIIIWLFNKLSLNHLYIQHKLNYAFILDSFSAGMCLVAQFFLIKKRIENWLIWAFNDFMCVFLFAYQNIYFTAALYGLLAVMATNAYFSWKKSFYMQIVQNQPLMR